jgi:hypothetical protein
MKFQGREGLEWWIGIVEDRDDPKQLNRVRVRIYGVHTHDKQRIATPDLPWAQVMMPTTSPSVSGLGTTTHGLVEGSTVMGFYRDAIDMQDPVVMGSFIGMPNKFYRYTQDTLGGISEFERTPEDGFNDPRLATAEDYNKDNNPDGNDPKHINRNYGLTLALDKSPRGQGGSSAVNYPKTDYYEKSDVNLLALGKEDAYPKIAEASGEPARSNYVKPIYPFNHVHETESGHVIELDDTPEYERLHAYHRSGTRVEVDKDGTYVEKIVRDKYTVILGSDTVKIQGAVDIEVGDSLAGNAIAAAGGAEVVANTATAELVDEDGNLTEAAKTTLTDSGIDDTDLAIIELGGNITGAPTEESLGDKIKTATEEATEAFTQPYDDLKNNETFKEFQTIVGAVEGINQGAAGAASVISQVEEHIGTELPPAAKDILTDVLAGKSGKDAIISTGVAIAKDKLTEVIKDTAVVKAIEAKLDTILEKAATSIEGMKAVVSEKVSGAVTSVLGEEAGAKAAAAMSGQMANAVSGVALGAVMSALSSALVNINVAGSAKVTTKGSTTLYSFGSTNVTSLMSTSITTLTGNTNLTTLLGSVTVNAPVGTVNVLSPSIALVATKITSTGVWTHAGAMNVHGLTTLTGAAAISGKTTIGGLVTIGGALTIAGTTTGSIFTHTHIAPSGGGPTSAGTG